MTKLAWSTVVTAVEEKTLTIGGKRTLEGAAELFTESGGWYIRFGNISLYTGLEKPPFEKGDLVKITIEKERRDGN